jgi:prepilin-type N-terminal cleavage/methylation domain-containing protein
MRSKIPCGLRQAGGLRWMDRAGGLTLIELLVVIAILAILAAIVLTSISRAQNSASKAADMNNLHQITTALTVYATDNNDFVPPPNWDNGGFDGAQGTNTGWLYAVNLSATGTNRFHVNTGLLWPMLQTPKVYFCPMDNPSLPAYSESQGGLMQRPQQLSSYAMNGAVVGFESMIYPPVKLSALRPTDCAFWETDERDPFYFNDGANYPGEGVSPRHYWGGIEGAFGGTVDYVRLTNWYGDVDFPGKNRLWCYPLSADGGDPSAPGHGAE